jgi:hypothetical protein
MKTKKPPKIEIPQGSSEKNKYPNINPLCLRLCEKCKKEKNKSQRIFSNFDRNVYCIHEFENHKDMLKIRFD